MILAVRQGRVIRGAPGRSTTGVRLMGMRMRMRMCQKEKRVTVGVVEAINGKGHDETRDTKNTTTHLSPVPVPHWPLPNILCAIQAGQGPTG